MDQDSFVAMTEAVRAFHEKHCFRELGGEEMTYRIALMAEELGEISSCVTKGRAKSELAEEIADLMILVLGTGIAQEIDLSKAFWEKMRKLERREGRMVHGRIRVSEFRGNSDA